MAVAVAAKGKAVKNNEDEDKPAQDEKAGDNDEDDGKVDENGDNDMAAKGAEEKTD